MNLNYNPAEAAQERHSGDLAEEIDYTTIRKAAFVLRALNHKLRQTIIETIYKHERLTVTELYVKLRLEQSVASQHLAILRRSGILLSERDGKYIFYTVNPSRIKSIIESAKQILSVV